MQNMVEYVFITKKSLPFKLHNIKCLQEWMNIELVIGDNVCNHIILYRSGSHIHDDFETFITIFGLKFLDKMNKKNWTVALRDFNTKSQTWCKSGITLS